VSAGGGADLRSAHGTRVTSENKHHSIIRCLFSGVTLVPSARVARGPTHAGAAGHRPAPSDLCCSVPLCRGEPLLSLFLGV